MYVIRLNEDIIHEPDVNSLKRLAAGVISEEVNRIPSFDFTIPISNPVYSQELHDRRDIVTVMNMNTGEAEFEGTVLTHTDTMTVNGRLYRRVLAEGYLGCLRDSIQPYRHYEGYTAEQFIEALLAQHNAFMPASKRIYLGLCDISGDNTNSKTTAYRSTLEEIEVNLIRRIGGEIRIRKVNGRLTLDYVQRIGVTCSTRVELAKNMKALTVETDSTNIITRLVPLGAQLDPGNSAERLTIAEVNDGKPYLDDETALAAYGVIMGTVVFDDITIASNLAAKGREYLTNNNRVRKAYEAQALDLSVLDPSEQSLRCGNTYSFRNELMQLDEPLRLLGRRVDIYKPYAPTLRIGDKAARITDIAADTAQLIEYELPKQRQEIIAAASARMTEMITNATKGYIYVDEDLGELLIMDAPTKAAATKVWRWNSSGFAYSANGYNEGYFVGLTADGKILADSILAGTLRGFEILNGNGTFRVYPNGTVDAAAINITGGSINISTSSESYDVIQLSCGAWTHKLSPLEWVLENSDTGCKIRAQAGALFFYYNGALKLSFDTQNGTVVSHGNVNAVGVFADDLVYKGSDDNNYSVRAQIEALWDYVTGGGS